jgi:3D (Asp-Asp-Asp) domain-containing protein
MATGIKTHWGAVAVDPRVIPLGSKLKIEGFGDTEFTALDTGGGVIGQWVDVWFPTDWEAIQHGIRNMRVFLVK